jgi:hypothetical protein
VLLFIFTVINGCEASVLTRALTIGGALSAFNGIPLGDRGKHRLLHAIEVIKELVVDNCDLLTLLLKEEAFLVGR